MEVDEILETLCAVGKARRGKLDGTFLPCCSNSKPLELNGLAAKRH